MRIWGPGGFALYEIILGELYQRGKMHHLEEERKAEALANYGIGAVVSLAPNWPDMDLEGWNSSRELPAPGRRRLFGCRPQPPRFRHVHHPIPDGKLAPESEAWLLSAARSLAGGITAGEGAVLTLCNAGRNRSALLSALIVRELHRCTGREAMNLVREARPRALANKHFSTFLEQLGGP